MTSSASHLGGTRMDGRGRTGFSLIEILIAILIFSVVSLAMVTVLYQASEIYRGGEAGRAAGDESMAVLGLLQSDLARALPQVMEEVPDAAATGGFHWEPSKQAGLVEASVIDAAGNCKLVVAMRPTSLADVTAWTATSAAVKGALAVAVWWVDGARALRRQEFQLSGGTDSQWGTISGIAAGSASGAIVANGCLHFGVWLSAQAQRRPPGDWESVPAPSTTAGWSSDSGPAWFPDAVRITLALTAGDRFAARGRLTRRVEATDTALPVSGLKALPTTAGSLVRVGDEWVRIEDFRGGRITVAAGGRGAWRTAAQAWDRGTEIVAAPVHSLVLPLPK